MRDDIRQESVQVLDLVVTVHSLPVLELLVHRSARDLTTEESGTSPSTSPTRSRTMKMRRQQTLSFLSRTTPRVKISVSADFKRHAAKISQQLRQRDRDRVWVVDPRDSCLLSTWDAITTCALIYSRRRLSRPLEPLQHTRAPLQHTRAPLQHTSFSVP